MNSTTNLFMCSEFNEMRWSLLEKFQFFVGSLHSFRSTIFVWAANASTKNEISLFSCIRSLVLINPDWLSGKIVQSLDCQWFVFFFQESREWISFTLEQSVIHFAVINACNGCEFVNECSEIERPILYLAAHGMSTMTAYGCDTARASVASPYAFTMSSE